MPFDRSEYLNPNRTIQRRMAEAEQPITPPQSAPPQGPRFGKAFTPDERKKQAAALSAILRNR